VKRFFFDFKGRERLLLDYRGSEFKSSHSAIDFAEMTAMRLTNSLTENWLGWSIEVRNAEGQMFSQIPIGATDFAAA
jgi:hypothetical protein